MKTKFIFFCMLFSSVLHGQSTNTGNTFAPGEFLGWDAFNGTNPLLIKTNDVTRMRINGIAAGYGVNTSGFVGMGTTVPASPMHIVGSGTQNAQGWNRAITLANSGALLWDGGGGASFFMAHPSSTPNGNWFAGSQGSLNAGATVDYAFTVHVNAALGLNPLRSTQIYKNLLVYQGGNGRRLGVNIVNPQRAGDIYSNTTQFRLSYGTAVETGGGAASFTDFFSNSFGNLQIQPSGGRVGVNATGNPTATLDVWGDARIRNVQAAAPNSLLIGVNANGASDVNVRRLDFTGNAGQVLLGNGTWGTLPASAAPLANNGVSRNVLFSGPYQLGDVYNISPFNTNTPLTANRQVRLGGNNFVFSGTGRVGIGLSFPVLPTEVLDVNGNGRFRTLPLAANQANNTVTKYVMVDEDGVLRWTNSVTGSGFGVICSDNTTSDFTADKHVELENNNFYFSNGDNTTQLNENRVGVGYDCGTALPGKISVTQLEDNTVNQNTTSGYFIDQDIANNPAIITNFYGVQGEASGLQPNNLKTINNGGSFYARSAQVNYGVRGRAEQGGLGNPSFIGVQNIGGQFEGAFGSQTATGVVGGGSEATLRNFGVSGFASSPTTPSQVENVGGQFSGAFSANDNMGVKAVGFGGNHAYGIYATASGGALNHAGYFNGDVEVINGTYISDQQFKDSVSDLSGSLKTLTQLKPVQYVFDVAGYPQFNFGTERQFGFIAQQVQNVFPNLVYQSERPAEFDSLGNVVTPALPYKSLNYNGFIPINTQAIIELNQKVEKSTLSDESIKTNVQDLTGSLNKVLDMRGISYDWNQTVDPELNLDSLNHIGFIAQEIAQVDARLTYLGDDSLMHVEYDKVVPILAEAIQELNAQVENLSPSQNNNDSLVALIQQLQVENAQLENENNDQQNEIDDLNDRLDNLENCLGALLPMLCSLNQSLIQNNTPAQQEEVRKNLNVTLSNRSTIVLDQNVPNPFAEQTVINFSIPATVVKAQIHFYDGNGKLIQSVDVAERGLGAITVFGSDLSEGTYTYTLVADGQIVATKKMMKQ